MGVGHQDGICIIEAESASNGMIKMGAIVAREKAQKPSSRVATASMNIFFSHAALIHRGAGKEIPRSLDRISIRPDLDARTWEALLRQSKKAEK